MNYMQIGGPDRYAGLFAKERVLQIQHVGVLGEIYFNVYMPNPPVSLGR